MFYIFVLLFCERERLQFLKITQQKEQKSSCIYTQSVYKVFLISFETLLFVIRFFFFFFLPFNPEYWKTVNWFSFLVLYKVFLQDFMLDSLHLHLVSMFLSFFLCARNQGHYFGEMALLTNEPRVSSVRAVKSIRCVYLTKDDFKRQEEQDENFRSALKTVG